MQTIEFKTPTGQRVMILPASGISLAEQAPVSNVAPSTWLHIGGSAHLVAGSIDTVAAACATTTPEPPLAAELEFMRLARARAELKLAKLQGPAVGRHGRRRTGSGER